MVTTQNLLQAIYDELTALCANQTSVSDADDHVGLLNRTSDVSTPFFGFEWSTEPRSRGINENVYVDSVTENGDTVDVAYRYERELFLDIGVLVDGDNPRTRDAYYDAVTNRFVPYTRSPEGLHPDVREVESRGATPESLAGDVDVGIRQTYVVDYSTTVSETIPAATSVNLDIDSIEDGPDTDVYPEKF